MKSMRLVFGFLISVIILCSCADTSKNSNLKEPSKADIIRYKLWLDQMCQCPYTGEIIGLSDIFTAKYEVEHIIPRARYLDNSYSNKVITRRIINDLVIQTIYGFLYRSKPV